jgi:hypothetical protein
LPRWEGSQLVFSFDGEKPFNCYSKVKSRLDVLVNEALGREANWQLHDLRRTVRTRLAGLGVPDTVAEQIIGQAARGWPASMININTRASSATRWSVGPHGSAPS